MFAPPLLRRAGAQLIAAHGSHCPRAGSNNLAARTQSGTRRRTAHRRVARYAWALLLARIYEVLKLRCPRCDADRRIIVAETGGDPQNGPPVKPERDDSLHATAASR